jgi:aryl-alcohol dehydrogenase-like predicted oxidoreductase
MTAEHAHDAERRSDSAVTSPHGQPPDPERGWVRPLGSTGLSVTPVGLGLAALGRPGYLNIGHGVDLGVDPSVAALERRTHAVLDAAYDAGVRYFDAARSYGRGEEFLASWLKARELAPGSVTVGSKWGYTYTADWRVEADPPEMKDLSVATFRRQVEETRTLLGPWLSLYQIHSATLSSGVFDDSALMSELAGLRAGQTAIGLTVSGSEQPETIDRALETGAFDAVQATFNLLERSAGPALERAHAGGLGVIVKEALANGRLTSRGDCEPLTRVAQRLGSSNDAVAIAAVLAEPWVDVVLSGAATPEQLPSNMAGAELTLDPQSVAELRGLAEPSDRYWSIRSELRWN